MKRLLSWLLLLLVLGLMLATAWYLPLPVPPYLDFQVIYHAGMGLLRGIPLYDHESQVEMIANLAEVQAEQVFVLPFPYPPWYALLAIPFVLLPIQIAARLWLELNVFMLMLSVFLMTEGWKPWKRLVAFPLALMFLPVLGALFVGQYVFPVLLGIALFVYALRHQMPLLSALALVLLTFKPHLGGLILLIGLVYLWMRNDAYGKRALWTSSFVGVFLFGIGFLADPIWPLNYFQSLTKFGSIETVKSCDICASIPVTLSHLIGLGGIQSSFWIASGLLLVFVLFLYGKRQQLFHSPDWLVATLALITLLSSPYLFNYDFVLLLVPLFLMAGQASTWLEWSLIGIIYLIPWMGLGVFGRNGNITLNLSALFLAGWLYQRLTKFA